MSSILDAYANLTFKGSGFSEFPKGDHLVRLVEIKEITSTKDGRNLTYNWGTRDAPEEVPAVGFSIIVERLPTVSDTSDPRPQSLPGLMVLPLVVPDWANEDLAAAAAARDAGDRDWQPQAKSFWPFKITSERFMGLLNVARGMDPSNTEGSIPEAHAEVQDLLSGGADLIFMVRHGTRQAGGKSYSDISFALGNR